MNSAQVLRAARRERRREAEVALAWAACRVDGQLHVDQWRALRVVLGRGPDIALDGSTAPEAVLERLRDSVAGMTLVDRAHLFLTTTWTAVANGRTHGAEVWLLCELRRALDLRPSLARRLYRLARSHRLAPGRRSDLLLSRMLAEGCRVAALEAAPAGAV